MKARRRFFDAGHYDFIADEIGRLIAEYMKEYNQVSFDFLPAIMPFFCQQVECWMLALNRALPQLEKGLVH